jgi:hypothetical protein
LIGDYSVKIQDQILAQGEVAKLIVFLNHRGIPAKLAEHQRTSITDSNFGDAQLDAVSKRILSRYLMRIKRLFW